MNNASSITIGQAIERIRERLAPVYPKREIEGFIRIIFWNLMNYETIDILLHKDTALPDFVVEKIDKVVDELLAHCPIQYVFGNTYFHGHRFIVDSSTLIPRPETEELVDMVADENTDSDLAVLDAGTGCGCIAISLALALRFPKVTGIDVSEKALAVARRNAEELHARVDFLRRDILTLSGDEDAYDIIVSNPPYIADSERASMDSNVTDYEPATALFVPDSDPLRFYRALAHYGKTALRQGGKLYFEINSRFPKEMEQLLAGMGYVDVEIRDDMQRLPRFAVAKKED